MSRPFRAFAAFAAAAFVVLATYGPLSAAIGPTVMMFHGTPLKKPVFVTGAETSAFGDLLRKHSVPPADLASRPFYAVALFWGPPSDPARNGVRTLTDLTPEMAWQHGRFYPSHGGQPALLLVTSLHKNAAAVPTPTGPASYALGGPVPPEASAVLARLGLAAK